MFIINVHYNVKFPVKIDHFKHENLNSKSHFRQNLQIVRIKNQRIDSRNRVFPSITGATRAEFREIVLMKIVRV